MKHPDNQYWTILLEFYEKLDFKVWKTYGIYLKDLK